MKPSAKSFLDTFSLPSLGVSLPPLGFSQGAFPIHGPHCKINTLDCMCAYRFANNLCGSWFNAPIEAGNFLSLLEEGSALPR